MPLRLPNLLIPGAFKAGTTSLYHYLAAHPECGMSDPKEPYFFTKGYSPQAVDRYRQCFARVPDSARVVGEASVTYLSSPQSAERIRTVLGDRVKFVFLLRNPIDRAMSAYWHVGKSNADRRKISEVLLPPASSLQCAFQWEQDEILRAREDGRIDIQPFVKFHDDPCWNFKYLRNSSYLEDLRRFRSIFGRQQMLVVLTEELQREPASTFRRIARFLELDFNIEPANLDRQYNTTQLVKRGPTARIVRAIARRLPSQSRWRNKLLQSTLMQKPYLDCAQRRQMAVLFHDHNTRLAQEFDLDLETFWR